MAGCASRLGLRQTPDRCVITVSASTSGIKNVTRFRRIALLVAAPILAGSLPCCATVNPRLDYQRAAETIERATGHAQPFQPEDEARVAARLAELLADGITAEEAAAVALLNNPRVQTAFYSIGVARADVVQSGLLSNPSFGMALRLPAAGGLANFEADLAQNIAEFWQLPVRQQAAEHALDRAILDVAQLAAEIAASAKSAHHAALGADRRLTIARENQEVARTILELTEFRRTAGVGSELDTNLARGVVLESDLVVQQARLASGSARRSLAKTLGLVTDADEFVLVDVPADAPLHKLDTDRLLEIALRERLDLRATLHATLSAERRLKLEYRRVFPTLELGVALERGERGRAEGRDLLADTARASLASGRLTAPEIEPRSARREHTDFIIGPSLSLELPIFDQNQAQIARARFEYEQAQRLLAGLEHSITQEVRGAADQAQTAWRIAHFYRDEVVPQAQRSLEMSRESYHAGKTSILSVLDAERTYLTARDSHAEALQAAASALPELERAAGLPWEEILRDSERTAQPAAQQLHGLTNGPGDDDTDFLNPKDGVQP